MCGYSLKDTDTYVFTQDRAPMEDQSNDSTMPETFELLPPLCWDEGIHYYTWKVKWFLVISLLILCITLADFLKVELSLHSIITLHLVEVHHYLYDVDLVC